jgi:hypothetical protein
MANPIAAISNVQQVTTSQQAAAPKPPANVTKVTPQDTVNISAAGAAASKANAVQPSPHQGHSQGGK